MIKLNIGCASRPLKNYINIDMDNLETIKKRYPNVEIPENIKIFDYDIFNLPYKNSSVDEIRAEALIEHLSFHEEPKFFNEIRRILKPGGLIYLTTPDFDKIMEEWQNAKDDWINFHRSDDKAISQDYWFGNNSYTRDNKWGYLTACIYGTQYGEGQYHKNCYTKEKLKMIATFLNFKIKEINTKRWKEDREYIIEFIANKI